ncbi:MAG: rhamnulose-1-phosphate aldolase [Bacteroidota bacterium]|nr:rhamnulose-1-phosphate aldolase [Bacteroidota bacterium]
MSLINLSTQVKEQLEKVSRIADYLWSREWAERNAGNISINLSAYFVNKEIQNKGRFIECDLPVEAGGLTLFVSGKGCYLRDLINKIDKAACILHINSKATGYYIIWGGCSANFEPTSELISHLKIQYFNSLHNPKHIAVVHTHPIELIVMSHHNLFQDENEFNKSLWMMCPEVRLFVPKGVSCIPYALPGSKALAEITIKGLKNRDVVLWEKHGALATGEDAEKAFDYLDVANKGAKLLLTAWSAGFQPKGLTDKELKELEQFLE